MNNILLADKIASAGTFQIFLKLFRFNLIVSSICAILMTVTVADLKFQYLRSLSESIESGHTYDGSKSYAIKAYKKLDFSSATIEPQYAIVSVELNSGQPFLITVISSYEKQFLQNISNKNLTLSYSIQKKQAANLYPQIQQVHEILKKQTKSEFGYCLDVLFSDYISTLFFFILCMSFTSAGLCALPLILKRRKIFLASFRSGDLESAKACTIERASGAMSPVQKYGNIYPWEGTLFKVLGEKDRYVIFNHPQITSAKGFILTYQGQDYFIPGKIYDKLNQKKAA